MRPTLSTTITLLRRWLIRYRVVVLSFVGLTLAFGLIGALWLPGYVKGKMESVLTDTLGRRVTLGDVTISPYRFRIDLKDLRIAQANGPAHLLHIQGISVNFSSASLLHRAPVIQALTVEGPKLKVSRDTGGRLSIADILERFAKTPPSGGTPQFAIYNIRLNRGEIEFQDQVKNKTHVISELSIGVPVVINFPAKEEIWIEPAISAKFNGAPFGLKGKTHPFSQHKEAIIDLELQDLPLAGLETYADFLPGLAINQGRLTSQLTLSFSQQGNQPATTRLQGDIRLAGLSGSYRPSNGTLHAAIDDLNLNFEGLELITPEFTSKSRVRHLGLSTGPKGTIKLSDPVLKTLNPFTARNFTFAWDNVEFTPESPSEISLSALINQGGKIQAKGSLSGWTDPTKRLKADLGVSAQQVDAIAFQRFVGTLMNNALFTRGEVNFEGRIQTAPTRIADTASEGLTVRVQGDGALNNLSLLDQNSSAEIARWKRLQLRGLQLTTQPLKVGIQQIDADGLFGRLTILPSGELNFYQVFETPKDQTTVMPTAAQPGPIASAVNPNTKTKPPRNSELPIEIGQIRLTDSSLIFTDQFTKPNFRASLNNLAGTLGPLKPGAPGVIDITGTIDRSAPLSVQGRIDPFGKALFLDIRAIGRGIEMPPMSPYSIKYLAYPIEKGKLSLNLSYLIQNGQLKAENQLFLDQLTLGEKVESPDAISAPVSLAIALLKNSRGEIDINLPISGSINDPEFKIGSIVFKALMNLIVKAATAPFTLIASLFGGGADLSQITFAPGSTATEGASAKAIDAIAKAMVDRPALKLDITGTANPMADITGAKQAILQRQVRAEKLAELAKKGESAAALREIQVSPEEYPKYLTAVYKKASFKKERNLLLMTKTLPVPEMEALLLQHIEVGETELLALADQRSRTVRNQLIKQGVPAERIFVLSSKLDRQTGTATTLPPGRAEFSLH
ncbi:MAG: DUF748 domain-containing protein [Burkholderiaceae bacterium]|nr:DUF748 domain-containing protein [Burkholderiaceae bacterium]